jgi:hypothetical protein
MRSHSRVVFVVLAVAVVALPLGTTAVFAQWSAPGEPIFNCENAAARYERMGRGLPAQQRLIERLQAQLAALDEAQATTDEEARDALVARSVDTVHSHASDELAALAEAKAKVLALPSHSTAQLRWIDKVSALEKEISALQKLTGTFRAGREYGLEIQSRSHTVAEHIKAANKLFVDSNLAEEIGGELAAAGGPLGVVAFEGSLFLLDYVVATEEGFIAARERNDLNETITNLQYGYNRVEDKMADLKRDCPSEFGEDPEPTIASTSHLTPPPPDSPAAPEEDEDGLAVSTGAKSGKGGAAVLAIAGAGVAVAGGLYAASVLSDMAETTGGGGECVSNRFCIVNSFSGGCSCSGSTRGECGWTGPSAGAGGSCGAGMPCAGGLSCNNGRCEGSSGRCPF